ncbi:hypothetical protein BASA82_000231 [Batrachochytrium salamandrivorans]|nr:hypothetical protein BASA82_000231 [Batrachochytrium salamandrivorans]
MDSNKLPRLEAEEEEEVAASIVDVRPLSSFLLRHLRGSVSFELATLGMGGGESTRATELPARSWPNQLVVMGTDEEEKNLGLDWLETRGWKVNRENSLTEATAQWDSANTETGQGSFLCKFWKASPVLEQKSTWMLNQPNNNYGLPRWRLTWAADLAGMPSFWPKPDGTCLQWIERTGF